MHMHMHMHVHVHLMCVLCLRAAADVTFDCTGAARISISNVTSAAIATRGMGGWLFLERSKLLRVNSGFLVDGKLKVSVNVTVETDRLAVGTPAAASTGNPAAASTLTEPKPALFTLVPTIFRRAVHFTRQLSSHHLIVLLAMIVAASSYRAQAQQHTVRRPLCNVTFSPRFFTTETFGNVQILDALDCLSSSVSYPGAQYDLSRTSDTYLNGEYRFRSFYSIFFELRPLDLLLTYDEVIKSVGQELLMIQDKEQLHRDAESGRWTYPGWRLAIAKSLTHADARDYIAATNLTKSAMQRQQAVKDRLHLNNKWLLWSAFLYDCGDILGSGIRFWIHWLRGPALHLHSHVRQLFGTGEVTAPVAFFSLFLTLGLAAACAGVLLALPPELLIARVLLAWLAGLLWLMLLLLLNILNLPR
jgi:hypothetical protein